MIAFQVNDMTCGHCASTITKAVKATDKDAKVTIDLVKHLVTVEPTEADAQELREAITEAGYTPLPVEAASCEVVANGPSRSGSCH
jgi:copper chaperone